MKANFKRTVHCGPIERDGQVNNDAAGACLAKVAVSHAAAGADAVAPSAMMDGQVMTIRNALDKAGFVNTLLMSYSTKFASAMYGPFREAEQSAPQKGDRKGYQASYRDIAQALRESEMDEAEGADILMVKPALFYLDVITRLRQATRLPIAAYNVSGEYAMIQAAADCGLGDLKAMVRESLFGIRRAGTDLIISYWAIVEAVRRAAAKGMSFGACTRAEVELAELIWRMQNVAIRPGMRPSFIAC